MRKVTVPNFCINFLNKAEKSLPILYDFAVAPPRVRGLKQKCHRSSKIKALSHPHGCVD